ncbi:MAG: WD40 repeat domain-containing protein, partial [Candidatus Sumerlaeia bacterium]|nr:WD40 repeat domain-containing protein [Candidatus Sumerlaeia bacterium]
MWDVETGERLRSFVGHEDRVTAVAYTPDGSRALTGSRDGIAMLWELGTGDLLGSFEGHTDWINTVATSPDGLSVLTGSRDTTARLWDIETGDLTRTFQGATNINAVDFSPDGSTFVMAKNNWGVWLWDTNTGRLIRTFENQGSITTNAVKFSPDGLSLLTGNSDHVARLWRVSDGLRIRELTQHSDSVTKVDFSPNGQKLITGSMDTRAIIWDVTTTDFAIIPELKAELVHVAMLEMNKTSMTVSADSMVRFIPNSWEELRPISLKGHADRVVSVAFSPDGRQALTGSFDYNAKLWDVETGAELLTFSGHTHRVQSVEFSPDGSRVLTGSSDQSAKLWDVETGEVIRNFNGQGSAMRSIAFSPNGTQAVIGSVNGLLLLWNMETGEIIRSIEGHPTSIQSVAFSSDGSRVLSGASDSLAKLWDVETGAEIRTFSGHTDWINSVVFCPDGSCILTGGSDAKAKIWDVATGFVLQTFSGHSSRVYSAVFTSGYHRMLTGSMDKTAKLWDVATGVEIREFVGHSDEILSTAYSPIGNRVLTGSIDKTARIWKVKPAVDIRHESHSGAITSLGYSSDGTRLFNTSSTTRAGQWNSITGSPSSGLDHNRDIVSVIAIPPLPSAIYATGSQDQYIYLWSTVANEYLSVLDGHVGPINSMAFSPDGTQLISSATGDVISRIWDVESGTVLRLLPSPEAVSAVAWSRDNTSVLTSNGNTGRVWNTGMGTVDILLEGHTDIITSVDYGPANLGFVVTSSQDTTARIWNKSNGEVLFTLSGHADAINDVSVSPNGDLIATASIDASLRLWDSKTGQLVEAFNNLGAAALSVTFHPTNRKVTTGLASGKSLTFEIRPPRAIIVSGGGPYPGNAIARQTHELGKYAYRTLLARGYTPDNVMYLDAFPEGHVFSAGGDPVSWDISGNGVPDIDGPATRTAFEEALTGEFATEAGRLLVLMIDHGYRTADVMAFRMNPEEAVTTTEVNHWLDTLQNTAPVDVTLVVDCCYSGQFVTDCRKTDAIPSERQRIVIASTTETNEAVFLPAPDLTSFMHTFLGSAYMGNSMGEAFRSGARFFSAFPVA